MDKPQPQCVTYYDYRACRDYLQEKYGYNERNYAGKSALGAARDAPFQDFWLFVVQRSALDRNDSFFVMAEEWGAGAEDWQQKILGDYMDEFGTGEQGHRVIEFHVWW